MPTAFVPLLTALLLGLLHAFEVDHMIAVSTFVADRPTAASAARFGFRWGVGHSVAVLLLGAVLLLTGLRWPVRWNAWGEALVGVMLIGLGLWALRASRKLHLHPPSEHGDHAHLHVHGGVAQHDHPHPVHPPHPPEHAHGHRHDDRLVTVVGLIHGLAGTSAVVALLPVTFMASVGAGLAYLAAFGVGVTAGMMIYAMVAAYAIRRAAERSMRWGRRVTVAVGVAGIGVGVWWVWSAVFA